MLINDGGSREWAVLWMQKPDAASAHLHGKDTERQQAAPPHVNQQLRQVPMALDKIYNRLVLCRTLSKHVYSRRRKSSRNRTYIYSLQPGKFLRYLEPPSTIIITVFWIVMPPSLSFSKQPAGFS
jgi:hypothetical protein